MRRIHDTITEFFALDELAQGQTAIHRLPPLSKFAVTLVYIVCVVSSPRYDFAGLAIYCFYPAVLIPLSELPFRAVLRRALPALPFVAFAGISNLIFERALSPLGVSYGVLSFATLLCKTLLCVSALVLLAATTPANALFHAMVRLHLPRVLVTTLMLCFRYLSLLANEAERMTRAYHLRALKQNGVEFKHLGSFIGQLLLRSLERAERVYAAMKCRGFDGSFPVSATATVHGGVLYALGMSAALIAIRLVGFTALLQAILRV